MKCYQCGKPAMFKVGKEEVPLCLDCNLKLTQMSQMQLEANERMINFLSDQMDYSIGLPVSGPRFPPRKSIHVGGINLNNIKVDNSTIGVLNTGNIESVDVSVTSLQQSGNSQLANAIKLIKEQPDSRRIIVNAWNPGELEQMALPPCHMFFQFFVANNKLSLQMYQRSCDMFLGVFVYGVK